MRTSMALLLAAILAGVPPRGAVGDPAKAVGASPPAKAVEAGVTAEPAAKGRREEPAVAVGSTKPEAAVPSVGAGVAGLGAVEVVGEREFGGCLKVAVKGIRVTLKPESEITDVIAWISGATCRGFIVATGLQLAGRKVTVFSPEVVSPAEAYRLFLALLETVGLTVEPFGRFLRVIEASKSPRAMLPVLSEGASAGREEGYVTRLVRVKHVAVTDLVLVLQSYRGEHGVVTGYPPAGMLLITDRAASLERLVALVAALDVPGEQMRLWTLPARHLSAVDLAQTLSELAGLPAGLAGGGARRGGGPAAALAPASNSAGGGGAASGATLAGVARLQPDDRAGRLLVVATDAAFARLAALAARLDVPAETRAAKVHGYRCRHADCDAVATMLATLADVQVARGPAPEGARNRPGAAAMPAPAAPAAGGTRAGAGAAPLFGGEVRVTSDPSTNGLLVLSSLDDFRTLRRLIEEIDTPRKQVYVEASIMEVLRTKKRDIGISYVAGRPVGEGAVLAGGFDAGRTLLLDESTLGSALVGLSGVALGAPLQALASALGMSTRNVPSVGAFIQLLQKNDNVDLIANPAILITNNHEGEISVGQRVSVPGAFTQSLGGAAGSFVPTVSVNREDVDLKLKLIPHVNEDGLIRLEIDQEMSELGTNENNLGPSTSRRTTHTTVFARDQQTIVISGLTRERVSDAAQKVPLLGDIPLIGFFFRNTQKVTEKQNIILALTPYVIEDPADLTRVLEAKLRDRREFARLFGSDEERRLLMGPLERRSTGMLEQIHRAVRDVEETEGSDGPTAGRPSGSPAAPAALPDEPATEGREAGLPLPGS